MRPIWKGSVSFGLVNIPVALYPATVAGAQIKLRMLRDKDHSPIQYKKVAEVDGREVPWEHIVKGYEYEKDEFVVLEKEDFEQVDVKSNQTVDIQEFVDLKEIDPMFFDEPYFLAPEKGGDKAYSLLRHVLEETGKVGIAKVVIKTREHLAAVKPMGKSLVLELMHFADELADPGKLSLPSVEPAKKELQMATSLVETMSSDWKPERYQDEYRTALMKIIEEKIAAGTKPIKRSKLPTTKPTNIVDLVSVLEESIKKSAKQPPRKTAVKRKKAVA